jgi:hypothetical protein
MENNLDVNFIVQAFQDKVNALVLEGIIKDATIKQLTAELNLISPIQETQEVQNTHQFKPKDIIK